VQAQPHGTFGAQPAAPAGASLQPPLVAAAAASPALASQPAAEAAPSAQAAPVAAAAAGSDAALDAMRVLEACGDALIEVSGGLCIVQRVLCRTAFGYAPSELVGSSLLSILHPDDHQPFVQTAQALLAMASSSTDQTQSRQHAVRALHRVLYRHAPDQSEPVSVDSIVTAVSQAGAQPMLLISSRCALPLDSRDGGTSFRVFPAGPAPRRTMQPR
tara:strand:+ start:91 stop:738 length:648 start_codon:yes stop_codon:yes gene_type:complete